ncbi:MAG: hypothetical protein RLZZ124_810 [Cyanobacteriota bacterium]
MSDGLLQTRAMFAPETINVEERTVELVWSTGAQVRRASWSRGDYIEELSMAPGAVRLDRLNKGGPLLDAHDSFSLRSQIGVVQRAWLDGNEGRALVKFSRRDDVEPIFQDVIDGIYRNVSVGYKVHKTERDETGAVPVERAVDWEPYELSLVPIPADAGAQVRSDEPTPTQLQQERSMDELNQGALAAEAAPENKIESRAAAPAAPVVDLEAVRAEERRRAAGILDAARKLQVGDELAHKLIADGVSLDEARGQLIDARSAEERKTPAVSRIEVTQDHGQKRAAAKLDYLKVRAGLTTLDQAEAAREYRGTTLLDMARESLDMAGINARGMDKSEIAVRALHSTSDFPLLMASIQRVTLKAAYGEEQQTWRPLAEQRNLPDFREMKEIEVGGQMIPEEIKEGGEYKTGTLQEQQGAWSLTEYGKKLVIGRRLIINDNLGYITRAVQVLARGVATLEANLMWGLITGNAKCMSDGVALFHASHNNTGTGVIGETAISEARQKMRNQKDFTGKNPLYVVPQYILLPTTLETAFDKFNTTIVPNQTSNVNIFSGYLQKIVEPRLDVSSTAQYYIVGNYPGVDKLVYGYLEGEAGPTIESEIKRDPDGITTYLRHDFGCMVSQHQAFYRSSGA